MTTLSKTHHRLPYAAIDPSSPDNSQRGRTILITGSSTGIGFAIARAFVIASASRVIITGRREDALKNAASKLTASKPSGSTTIIMSQTCDVADSASLKKLWQDLKIADVDVDVLVLNAAFTGPLDISGGLDKVWKFFEMNVLESLRITEQFLAQGSVKGKVLLNISTAGAHMNPSNGHSAYSSSKASFAHMVQHLADEVPVDRCQILSCHPGRIFTEGAIAAGFSKKTINAEGIEEDTIPWDSEDLPASWCVWASTAKAAFLHGRFLWTDWDVDELLAMKEKFQDVGFLKIGLQGVDPVRPADLFAMK